MPLPYRLTPSLTFLLLLTGAPAWALIANDNSMPPQTTLPDLGIAPQVDDDAKHFAEMAKKFGEASMSDNGLTTGEQARMFAISKIGNEFSHQLENWLSPWGNANIDLLVDKEGNFTGSKGSWFVPLQDNERYLTWNQYSVTRRENDLVGNVGLGQRWRVGSWLLGYNSFYDKVLSESLARGSIGAEAWGEYLRLSANYYHPLGDWQLREIRPRSSGWPLAMT